jgi:hypothetical protein
LLYLVTRLREVNDRETTKKKLETGDQEFLVFNFQSWTGQLPDQCLQNVNGSDSFEFWQNLAVIIRAAGGAHIMWPFEVAAVFTMHQLGTGQEIMRPPPSFARLGYFSLR